MMKRALAILWLVLLASGMALAQAQEQQAQEPQEMQDRAAVRIIHLALQDGDVEVRLDGEARIPRVAANTASGYVFVAPGQHEITAVPAAAQQEEAVEEPAADPAAPADPAQAPTDPAAPADPAQAPADPAAQPEPQELFTTTVDLQPGTYTTIVVVSTTGEVAQGGPATEDALQIEGMQEVRQSIEEARNALDQEDAETAGQAIQSALDQLGTAMEQAEGDVQATLEASRTMLEQAQQALQNDDLETARVSLQDVEAQLPAAEAQPEAEPAEGEAQEAAATSQTELVVLQDQFQAMPQANQAMVRLVNAARIEGLNLVGVFQPEAEAQAEQQAQEGEAQTEQQGEAAPVQGENQFSGMSGLGFGAAGEYQQVPASVYHLQVQRQDGTVALDLPDTTLQPGVVYSFFTSATEEGNVLLTITVDAGVNAAAN